MRSQVKSSRSKFQSTGSRRNTPNSFQISEWKLERSVSITTRFFHWVPFTTFFSNRVHATRYEYKFNAHEHLSSFKRMCSYVGMLVAWLDDAKSAGIKCRFLRITQLRPCPKLPLPTSITAPADPQDTTYWTCVRPCLHYPIKRLSCILLCSYEFRMASELSITKIKPINTGIFQFYIFFIV